MAFEYEITLGHYGLPHIGGKDPLISGPKTNGKDATILSIPGRRLAMIIYHGWDALRSMVHEKHNAEAEVSAVLYASKTRMDKNPPVELLISVMLHRTDDGVWTEEELSPIRSIDIREIMPSGSPVGAFITLANGEEYTIDFKDIDGKRMC